MSLFSQKNMISIFIFLFLIIIMNCASHPLNVSLVGCFVSLGFLTLTYVIQKYHIQKLYFVAFHLISIMFVLIFQTPEVFALALLTLLLRESILLAKNKAEKGSRICLLSDLGMIKPKRQLSLVFKYTMPFIIASFTCSFLSNLFTFPPIALAYFALFLFAIGFGSLIVEELSFAATE
ncbi:hypothetical protein [Silvanigrella sp.]|uniref:hypothetical protein n=1 Tax=Silvanigrella sp. TaxID=2024976 RepID=UPI0037C88E95